MIRQTIYGVLAVTLLVGTLVVLGLVSNGVSAQGTPTPSPDPDDVLELARNFSGSNADWTPVIEEFDGVAMVLVPAGCFMMGSTQYIDESPMHRVCFEEPFWIDRTEVTNGQFAAFNGKAMTDSYFSGEDRPREQITSTEAAAFCESRGTRLPTEAEWEYAARGPDGLVYPWGNEWDQNRVIGFRNAGEGTASVGGLPAGVSWVGALDMSGSVWEWVADWYGADYYETLADGVVNPTGPASGNMHVLRGGSWSRYDSNSFRAAIRWIPLDWSYDWGFRCARSMDVNSAVPALTTESTPEPTPELTLVDPETASLPAGAHNADWMPVIQEFDGVAMVLVPAGCFEMGSTQSDDEHPVHQVCFEEPFWIDRFEVTNEQFPAFNGQAATVSRWAGNERPREQITWTEAAAFCESRGARLPTEAEWEYAARGPEGLVYPWGDAWDPDRVVWDGNSNNHTADVGSKPTGVSWVGALDLSGNVYEWVADWYGPYPEGSQVNPQGPESGEYRVMRGGAWLNNGADVFRAASRYRYKPQHWDNDWGFRCVRSMDVNSALPAVTAETRTDSG